MQNASLPSTSTQAPSPSARETTLTNSQKSKIKSPARARAYFQNVTYEARGTLIIDTQDYYYEDAPEQDHAIVTYGYKDLMVWVPSKRKWISLPDKFYVKSHSIELARAEFWARWKAYVSKRFNLAFLKITTTATERN